MKHISHATLGLNTDATRRGTLIVDADGDTECWKPGFPPVHAIRYRFDDDGLSKLTITVVAPALIECIVTGIEWVVCERKGLDVVLEPVDAYAEEAACPLIGQRVRLVSEGVWASIQILDLETGEWHKDCPAHVIDATWTMNCDTNECSLVLKCISRYTHAEREAHSAAP